MKKLNLWLLAIFALSALTFTACDDEDDDVDPIPEPTTIVSFAVNSNDYTILADAVVAADLDGVLSGTGPFTVFAPDNAAFQALLDSNPDWNSLDDIPVATLTAVLTNHVVAGEVTSSDLMAGFYPTLSATGFGDATTSLYVNLDNGVVLNGGPEVVAPDVDVDNGVIHGVNEVILPPTVVDFAVANPGLSSLVAALTRSDLSTNFVEALSGAGPFTVFAPSNDAFQALLDSNDDWNTLADIPVGLLETVLSYHVSSGVNARSTDLSDGMMVSTLAEGETLQVDLSNPDAPQIVAGSSTATVVAADIQGANGVVHVIDTVLLP
ncbi:MAG: fasciclin domain-containing protein [Phaeodactylibacter sp.]|nr:fasciclin domain-containing protein [Phaeodactylibacter sp.]